MTRRDLPTPRAIGLFARTVFRELGRAAYTRTDVVTFVNELLEMVTSGPSSGPPSSVTDPETRLASPDVLLEVLGFELDRAKETGAPLSVIAFELSASDVVPDDALAKLQRRLADQLVGGVRPTDTVGRANGHYVVALSGAPLSAAAAIAARLAEPVLARRRQNDAMPPGTTLRFRAAAARQAGSAEGPDSPESLVQRAIAAPPVELREGTRVDGRAISAPPAPAVPTIASDVVVAFGGGAARAAAHIGVLRAFAEAGIRVRAAAGASAGALVAAMAASGMDHEEMLRRFAEFPQTASYARMRRAFAEYRRSSGVPRAARKYFRDSGIAALSATTLSAFDDEMLEQFVAHFVGPDRSISSLGRPFSAAATDLVEGRTVSLMTGSLHVALCASCAAPGLFAPQKLNGRVLIDGAMMSELPIAAAMALGDSAPVVAVHLTRPESRIHEYASSSEVAIRTSALVRRELVREQLRHSLHLVSVPVDEVRWLDFRRSTEMEKVGFEAASAFIARRRRT